MNLRQVLPRLWRSHVDDPVLLRSAAMTLLAAGGTAGLPHSPRHVLMLIPSLAAGGAERQLVLTAKGLAARGWQVEVAAKHLSDPVGNDALLGELDGIAAALLPFPAEDVFNHAALSALPPHFRALLVRAHALMARRRPAVVHAWMDEMAAVGGLAAAMAGVPRIVLAGRNLAPHRFGVPELGAIQTVLRLLADDPRVVFVNNSHAGAEDYAQWLGLPAGRIAVLRNGFVPLGAGRREAWRSRLGIPLQAPVVGGLFRLAPEKRPLLWVETAAALARRFPAMHFVVFGEGPLRKRMESLVRRRGLAGRLHLPGLALDRGDALAALDVFLLTSAFEGTPNVALEAQWSGVPMVVTHAGGMAEALADFSPVEPLPEALAEAVAARLRHPALPLRQWVEERFGLERMLAETEGLYA